ncbi:MAG: alpha/beta hydrolase [Polyangiales bacterium]
MTPRESLTSMGRSSLISMQPFTYEEGSISKRAGDAPTLAYQLAVPAEPKAAVLLVHGYGEHGGRYRRVVQKWANQKLAVAVLDLRGHGWSAGERGHCNRFGEYHDDLDDTLAVLREHVRDVPLFGFGHSFGGLLVSTYALSRSSLFRGLVLSSPYFGLALQVPQAKKVLGELASKVWPSLHVPTGLSGKDVTHDETLARLYDNDPLVNKVATARWFTETVAAQHDLFARASQLTTPVLMVQAGADRVVSPAAARAVFDRFSSSDKTYDERAGLFHEILNEPPHGDQIADEMAAWILARA